MWPCRLVGAGSRTQVLFKSSWCSYLLKHCSPASAPRLHCCALWLWESDALEYVGVPAEHRAPGWGLPWLTSALCLPSCVLSPHTLLMSDLWFSFQAERPALNVVIFPLLHEGLTDVIRDVPMVHLDEITLFKSRVAEEPPNLWW